MVKPKWAVRWTNSSNKHLREAFDEIKEYSGSEDRARKIVSEIYEFVEELRSRANLFQEDCFKINNDGSFKACEKHKYRISYKIEENVVIVLRIRPAQKDPIYH